MINEETEGQIIVVDDDISQCKLVEHWLTRARFRVDTFHDGESCLAGLQRTLPDAICLDINMPGLGGLQTLEQIKNRHKHLPVLILTADSTVDTVVAAMQLGAYDYITKPIDQNKLVTTMRNAVERYRMALRLESLEREATQGGYPGIVGESEQMRTLYRQIDRLAPSDVTVLIHGESGTGKELVARALHSAGGRADAPFIALNCAAIPETLQESELFGHEKGAFTGATRRHVGRFEQANGGTLFLDEVAELSLALQAKLLRAIQERRFHRVGGTTEVRSDFRLLAASHRDLTDEVRQGRFREDLFYRIAVFELEIPRLADRNEDILVLAEHFLREFGGDSVLAPETRTLMHAYDWPGNVRELENAMQRAGVLAMDGLVLPEHLPPRIRRGMAGNADRPHTPRPALSDASAFEPAGQLGSSEPAERQAPGALPAVTLEELEQMAVMQAMERCRGNVSEVGRQLGIGRTSLYRKLHKYGLR